MNTNPYYLILSFLLLSCSTIKKENQALTNKEQMPKNIVLMIGDGMGLSQISAGMYKKGGSLNLEEAKYIGLIKTNSASSIITDSAAGATAFSSGEKTYNGSINMSQDTIPLEPITMKLHDSEIKTGVISTSSVTHATPACFYGNQINRYGVDESLAEQFLNSNINVLIGGGEDYFNKRSDGLNLIDSLKKREYTVIDSIADPIEKSVEKLINFCAPKEPVSIIDGRGSFLELAAIKALSVLNTSSNGFFLMIEGSQIDWGGHDMDSDYIISEMIDFDNTIKEVLEFAKEDQNTLVLVTADHETGGYGIVGGNIKSKTIQGRFLNDDHTATMVPLFAFGPGAEKFIGTYHNHELHYKILDAFQISY
tara:strand:+ start:15080 stop:16177 length:1098 start_codon:yes stop_codon:yes gene_type:complete